MNQKPGLSRPSVELKTKAEIQTMQTAGRIAGLALQEVGRMVAPGITTKELNRVAEASIRKAGAKPTFVGYRGYPATLCVSINEEVVHGIPGSRKIQKGDLVSIDVAATYDGFVGDTAATFFAGEVSAEAMRLSRVTEEALGLAIDQMRAGNRLGDVEAAVQTFVEKNGFGVVRDFVGHGIGRCMHEEPAVPNYGEAGTGLRLEPGLVLAIEPMVTQGHWKTKVKPDGWTVVTEDGSWAAHFEHTVAVTEDGPLVLTKVD